MFKVGLFKTKIKINWRICNSIFFPRSAVFRVVPLICCTLVHYKAARNRKSTKAAKIACAEKLRCWENIFWYLNYCVDHCCFMKQTIYDCQGFPSG